MKATTALFVLLLLVFAGGRPALAQHEVHRMRGAPADTSEREMSRGRMPLALAFAGKPATDPVGLLQTRVTEEAMNDPLRRSVVLLYALPTFGAPLGLSPDQVGRLRQAHAAYLARIRPLQQRAAWAGQQLDAELALTAPNANRVRALLRERAFQESDVTALAFEDAAGMLAVLTPVQHQALADLDPLVLHRHLKTHLTAAEMLQAMGGPSQAGLLPAPPPK
jgi:hypothetical protein